MEGEGVKDTSGSHKTWVHGNEEKTQPTTNHDAAMRVCISVSEGESGTEGGREEGHEGKRERKGEDREGEVIREGR